jgi:hypothetical protein
MCAPSRRLVLAALALVSLVGVAACGPSIGDGCTTNVDCSRLGDRSCDVASPGGYCTVDGCNANTCPDGALCIRFLSALPTRPCDLSQPPLSNGCAADETCLCDLSVEGVCQGGAAHCAPQASERRFCQKPCSADTDCRNGYECRSTGTRGAELVPALNDASLPSSARFCSARL